MNTATIAALVVAVVALLGVAVLVVLFTAERRRHVDLLLAQRAELDELRAERLVQSAAVRLIPRPLRSSYHRRRHHP